jgi:hypothetical protein
VTQPPDGKKQRNALTAAENAVRALGRDEPARAKRSAATAADLDQIGAFTALPGAVERAVNELEAGGAISASVWEALSEAVGPGPVQALIMEVREGS